MCLRDVSHDVLIGPVVCFASCSSTVVQSGPQTDMAEKRGWDQSQLRKYDIPLDEIPRLSARDPRVDEFIAENVSILIKQAVI